MSRQLWPLSYGPGVRFRCASVYHVLLALDEALQPLRPRGVPQLPQRLRLDLADALARHLEVLPDLLERVVALLADFEPHPEDLLLAGGEGGEHLPGLLREVHVDDRVGGGDERLVLDEVPEVAVLLLADRGLEADGLLRDLEDLADLVERELHLLGDLLRRRLAPELLHEIAARPDELVDRLDHVDGDADRPRLVGDRARDRLADPPRCIGRELVAALVLELVDRLHEADVPLLDEVEELQAAVRVLLRDRHDEPQIRLDELGLRPLGPVLALADRPVGAAQVLARHLAARRGAVLLARVRLLLDAADLSRGGPELAVELLELLRGAAELLRDLLPLALVLARVAQHPRELAPGHPGAPLGVEPVPVRLLEPLDEPLQLHDDPVDLLLVELDRLEVLHHVGLDGLDLVPQLAALHLRHLLRREGLAELPDLALELADVVDVLQHVLDLLLLLLRDLRLLGLRALGALDRRGAFDCALDLDLDGLLLDLLLLALRLLLVARVLHDLADADLALAEALAELEDLADRDRRRQDRGEDLLLALLDPLRNLDLALARQEGDRPHLAQVHAHGVVRLAVAGVLLGGGGGLGLELLLVVGARRLAELRALLALAWLLALERLLALRHLLALRDDLGDGDLLALLPERLLRLLVAGGTRSLRGARGLGLHAVCGADDALPVLPHARRRLLRLRGRLLGRLLRGVALAGHVALLLVRLGCSVVVCVTAPRRASPINSHQNQNPSALRFHPTRSIERSRFSRSRFFATRLWYSSATPSMAAVPAFATCRSAIAISPATRSRRAFTNALRSSRSAASRGGRAGPAMSQTDCAIAGSSVSRRRASASSDVAASPMIARARSASGPAGSSVGKCSSSATGARSG